MSRRRMLMAGGVTNIPWTNRTLTALEQGEAYDSTTYLVVILDSIQGNHLGVTITAGGSTVSAALDVEYANVTQIHLVDNPQAGYGSTLYYRTKS